jgi:membrane fusion protein (multidrug efflux system)
LWPDALSTYRARVGAAFSQTLRALTADRPRASLAAIALSVATLGAWAYWLLRVEVTLYAVTDTARVEVEQRAHAVDAPVSGRIARLDLVIGHEVRAGEVLVELDTKLEERQKEQLEARLAAIDPELAARGRELAAQKQALGDEERATLATLDEGRARLEEAALAAKQADDESKRGAKLREAGLMSEMENASLASLAGQKKAAAGALRLDLEKVQREQKTRGSQGIARIEQLRGAVAALEGQRATILAETRVIDESIAKSAVRAPIAGRIGEIAPVNVGGYVRPGDRLFSVVPPGELRAVAQFVPADALGRVRPKQRARLRLHGFPWMQYGTVACTVGRVGGEVRDDRVRVELEIEPDPARAIPMQHGLPATAEIDVERITPARLVLRSLGARLGQPMQREAGN